MMLTLQRVGSFCSKRIYGVNRWRSCFSLSTPSHLASSSYSASRPSSSSSLTRFYSSSSLFTWDAEATVARASTLPASFYTHSRVLEWEKDTVFSEWLCIAPTSSLSAKLNNPGDFVTGSFLQEPWLLVRDEQQKLHAFSNVCQHHAMPVAPTGASSHDHNSASSASPSSASTCSSCAATSPQADSAPVSSSKSSVALPFHCGSCTEFVCPYHNWKYALNGKLKRATRMAGIENFKASTVTLPPLPLKQIGPFLFVKFPFRVSHSSSALSNSSSSSSSSSSSPFPSPSPSVSSPSAVVEDEASLIGINKMHELLSSSGYEHMKHVRTLTYELNCNWKVAVDNYLDGGLHVEFAHPALNAELNMKDYQVHVFPRCSVQSAPAAAPSSTIDIKVQSSSHPSSSSSSSLPTSEQARVSGRASYIFVFPNLMLNRYGKWLDTNVVLPLSHDRCLVVIDYFLEQGAQLEDAAIETSLQASDQVQQEDVMLCEGVQRGLNSRSYARGGGRYAPRVEHAMHDFHVTYYKQLEHLVKLKQQ